MKANEFSDADIAELFLPRLDRAYRIPGTATDRQTGSTLP
jgi:hypothetical protein